MIGWCFQVKAGKYDAAAEKEKLLGAKAMPRFFGAFEKDLKGNEFLVGKKMSIADTTLLRVVEEIFDWHSDAEEMMKDYPEILRWRQMMRSNANMKKFLDSNRRMASPADLERGNTYVAEVKTSLNF
jgi:glutathione S-transferase